MSEPLRELAWPIQTAREQIAREIYETNKREAAFARRRRLERKRARRAHLVPAAVVILVLTLIALALGGADWLLGLLL